MRTLKTPLCLMSLTCAAMLSVSATAAPPHRPDLVSDGNEWTLTVYFDDSSGHRQSATQRVCFFPDGVSDMHQRYIWVSTTYPDWNGRATQEGDQIFMHGDYQRPQGKIDVGHDGMQWEIVTMSPRNEGAGHWHEWAEDGRVGQTVIWGNIKFVRSGRCPFSTWEEAFEAGRQLPLPVDQSGRPMTSPTGSGSDIQ
jgi:hypothetical protein